MNFEQVLSMLASPSFFRVKCIKVLSYLIHCLVYNKDKFIILVKIEFNALFTDPKMVNMIKYKVPLDFEIEDVDFSVTHMVVKAANIRGLHKMFFYKLEKARSCYFPYFSKSLVEMIPLEKVSKFKFMFDNEGDSTSRLITLPANQPDHLYDVYDIGDHLLEMRCEDRKCAANYSLTYVDNMSDGSSLKVIKLGDLILPKKEKKKQSDPPYADLLMFVLLVFPLVVAANMGIFQEGRRQAIIRKKHSGKTSSMFEYEKSSTINRDSSRENLQESHRGTSEVLDRSALALR